MRWYSDLYLGSNAAHNIHEIRKKAVSGKLMAGVYYITLSSVPGNLLDIFHNGMLRQSLFAANQCTDIVGVAEGKLEAVRLVQTIIQEIYEKTGGFDVRGYFKEESFVEE
ncbi:MAG: hypothetical protein IKV59_01745 [Lachnospiraceae bacterium]|nr:hypothetical protein [Lachnospiraceae bacterium]